MKLCPVCGNIKKRLGYKYCSNKCQAADRYNKYIKDWKLGTVNEGRGVETKNISRHIKRYLFEKYNGKCSVCGWNETHPITRKAPLEVDHINGDSRDNSERNLRIVCPNCHSLSPNFRNLNNGNGRIWRKLAVNRN